MYNISSKPVNVATSYKRLRLGKIAVFHNFQPTIVIKNLKIVSPFRCLSLVFVNQSIPMKFLICMQLTKIYETYCLNFQ